MPRDDRDDRRESDRRDDRRRDSRDRDDYRRRDDRDDRRRDDRRRDDRRDNGDRDLRDKGEISKSLLVRNVSYKVRSDEIRHVMEKYGEVRDVYIPTGAK